MNGRTSGILLPLSSLPSPYGIGSLGKEAYEFINYLKSAGASWWQMLPLGPTSYGDSPYQTFSSYAGNPYFIDLPLLLQMDLITQEELEEQLDTSDKIDYAVLFKKRFAILRKAFSRINDALDHLVRAFYLEKEWVRDYSLFMALKNHHNQAPWYEWKKAYKFRDPDALYEFGKEHTREVLFWSFLQYLFDLQWSDFKVFARKNGISILGDIPLYVAMDSVDVWTNPELFQLDDDLLPTGVAGFPPDDFSAEGQLWGNPLYDWQVHAEEQFEWWIQRLKRQLELFDLIRLDHFIGFQHYWWIPAGDTDAKNGNWKTGPGSAFFQAIQPTIPGSRLIAEDLGIVTPEVIQLRKAAGIPSMRVMQFAFDPKDDNEHMPHHFDQSVVAYLGTHDNDTLQGWWKLRSEEEKDFVRAFLDFKEDDELYPAMRRALFASGARIAILTMQDQLLQDNSYRINTPNTLGNWVARIPENYAILAPAEELMTITKRYRRNPDESL